MSLPVDPSTNAVESDGRVGCGRRPPQVPGVEGRSHWPQRDDLKRQPISAVPPRTAARDEAKIARMTPRLLSSLTSALFIAACLGACEDDTGHGGARVCEGTVENGSLSVFEQCQEDAQCGLGLCILGYCPEPCAEENDCINFGGGVSCDGAIGFCRYLCQDDGDCPQFPGNPMVCAEGFECRAPADACGS